MEDLYLESSGGYDQLLGASVDPVNSTVVTYYSDVGDEVDAHFTRALLQQQMATSPPQQPPSLLDLSSTCNEEEGRST